MARKSKVVLICDKHRGDVEAVGTLEIIIDGQRRKLDLCADHLAEARRVVRPWLRAATTSAAPSSGGGSGPSRSGRSNASTRRNSAMLREWAVANGYELPGRGRIPRAVHEAYEASK
jgi:hypothetical protein